MSPPPAVWARFRVAPEDFQVEELLGYGLDGQGEHLHLWVEKRGANTAWVAGELARWAGVAVNAVAYAGMKDRHALTWQWFAVHLPRRIAPEQPVQIEGVRVLEQRWHGRKLRRGAHQGNRFRIVLRDVEGDIEAAMATLRRIEGEGVPNAFGEQRFGRDAGNVAAARDWLAASKPARLPHQRRGLLLSAARAHLFNAVLVERVGRGDWNRPLPGDCFQLDGRGSWFGPETVVDGTLSTRVAAGDIHPTGPLWGAGEPPTAAEAAAIEQAVAAREPVLAEGLARAGLRQERRPLRLVPKALSWRLGDGPWQGGDDAAVARIGAADEVDAHAGSLPRDRLEVAFELGRGSFATAVLADVCTLQDCGRAG